VRCESIRDCAQTQLTCLHAVQFFDGSGWFTGRVVSHDGTYYYVVYDDGDEEEYNDQELAEIILTPELEQVTIGSRVAVYRRSDDQYYEATVARERIDRKPLYLKFDNGDSQWVDLREEQFILLEQRARRRIRLQSPKNKSTNTEDASEAPPSNDLAGIAIGSRLAVYRPSTDQYHEATVTQEQDGDNRFYCEYAGGAGEWLNLNQRDFIALEGHTNINDILPDTKEAKHDKPRVKSSPPKKEGDVPKVTPKKEESISARRDKPNVKVTPSSLQQNAQLKQSTSLSDLDKVDIGSHVAVYRPNDEQYYEAVVTRKRFIKKPFFLEYTNGDREWVDFRHHKFILLEDMPGRCSTRRRVSSENKRKAASAASASNDMVSEEKSPKGNKRRRIETSKEKGKASDKTKGRLKSCNGSFNTPKHKGSSGIQSAGAAKPKGKSNHDIVTKAKGKAENDVGAIAKGIQKYAIGTRVKKVCEI
jgi:hypothetical protein